jgi:hypothetical protein
MGMPIVLVILQEQRAKFETCGVVILKLGA